MANCLPLNCITPRPNDASSAEHGPPLRWGVRRCSDHLERVVKEADAMRDPQTIELNVDPDGALVTLAASSWYVCFVPGLDKQWWHRFVNARHKHVFAIRPAGPDEWTHFEPSAADGHDHLDAGEEVPAVGRARRCAAGSGIDPGARQPATGLDELCGPRHPISWGARTGCGRRTACTSCWCVNRRVPRGRLGAARIRRLQARRRIAGHCAACGVRCVRAGLSQAARDGQPVLHEVRP